MSLITLAHIKPRKIMKVNEKTCTSCVDTKPIDQFKKASHAPDGHESRCKTCWNAYGKQKREEKKRERRQFI